MSPLHPFVCWYDGFWRGDQERHSHGLFPDPGPPLVVAKRCDAVSFHARGGDVSRLSPTAESCYDFMRGSDAGFGDAGSSKRDALGALLRQSCTIADSELRRVGWAKLFDPLATNPSESLFWCNFRRNFS